MAPLYWNWTGVLIGAGAFLEKPVLGGVAAEVGAAVALLLATADACGTGDEAASVETSASFLGEGAEGCKTLMAISNRNSTPLTIAHIFQCL